MLDRWSVKIRSEAMKGELCERDWVAKGFHEMNEIDIDYYFYSFFGKSAGEGMPRGCVESLNFLFFFEGRIQFLSAEPLYLIAKKFGVFFLLIWLNSTKPSDPHLLLLLFFHSFFFWNVITRQLFLCFSWWWLSFFSLFSFFPLSIFASSFLLIIIVKFRGSDDSCRMLTYSKSWRSIRSRTGSLYTRARNRLTSSFRGGTKPDKLTVDGMEFDDSAVRNSIGGTEHKHMSNAAYTTRFMCFYSAMANEFINIWEWEVCVCVWNRSCRLWWIKKFDSAATKNVFDMTLFQREISHNCHRFDGLEWRVWWPRGTQNRKK